SAFHPTSYRPEPVGPCAGWGFRSAASPRQLTESARDWSGVFRADRDCAAGSASRCRSGWSWFLDLPAWSQLSSQSLRLRSIDLRQFERSSMSSQGRDEGGDADRAWRNGSTL